MADPALMDGHVDEIRELLRELVGAETYERNYRVVWDGVSRLLLESVCLRGGPKGRTRAGVTADAGADPARLFPERLREALAAHGLDHRHYLRRLDPHEPVPWDVVNDVDRDQEIGLMAELDRRAAEHGRGRGPRFPCGDSSRPGIPRIPRYRSGPGGMTGGGSPRGRRLAAASVELRSRTRRTTALSRWWGLMSVVLLTVGSDLLLRTVDPVHRRHGPHPRKSRTRSPTSPPPPMVTTGIRHWRRISVSCWATRSWTSSPTRSTWSTTAATGSTRPTSTVIPYGSSRCSRRPADGNQREPAAARRGGLPGAS